MELEKEKEYSVMGKKIGDIFDGAALGLDGFKLKITGLSDKTGAPSRKEVEGTAKTWPLIRSGPGVRHAKKGFRGRRLIRGNMIGPDTGQVNSTIEEYGSIPLDQVFKPKEKKE
jgi:small subunit ribosomal protein S6e